MHPQIQPGARCDLHLHTNRSDGRLTPSELIDNAIESRLDIIALTDHDLTSNIGYGVHRRHDKSIYVINGAEMSGHHDGFEFHLLVYFTTDAPADFQQLCTEQVHGRQKRYQTAVNSLNLKGVASLQEILAKGSESVTRHHLAKSIVEAGHASSMAKAFRLLSEKATIPRLCMPFIDCIRAAKNAGGITSWAHPPAGAVKQYIQEFVHAGLDGLEALRPGVGASAKKTYKKAVKRYDLLMTGGSDWHGWSDSNLGLFYIQQRELRPFFDRLWKTAA